METKIFIGILIAAVLLVGIVFAHGEENFNETKELIDSNISCDKLTNEQLNEIGDYYMEQMHPGESHELMHDMMGGEDSETVKLMHINMAKGIYCGENSGMMGMMNMMSGSMMGSGDMMGGGMMSSGMMGNNMMSGGMMSSGMMSRRRMMDGYGSNYYNWNVYNVLYLVLLIGLVILVYLLIIRFWRK